MVWPTRMPTESPQQERARPALLPFASSQLTSKYLGGFEDDGKGHESHKRVIDRTPAGL